MYFISSQDIWYGTSDFKMEMEKKENLLFCPIFLTI